MRTKLFASVAFAALILPSAAFAQSTGSVDFEEENEIVVTGTAVQRSIGGVEIPDTPKSKVVIDAELIQRQRPGQTVNDIINLSPGVSFQNNDATGAAGGTFTIRGFDSTRISQTVDGIPLNDTGNYAIYSNQQQDPETLSSVSVNLGTTDIDSPTASASGGTVNIRTRVPSEELGALFSGTLGTYAAEGSPAGERMIYRVFGMLDTGDFTGIGTRAFVSASWTKGDNPFNNYGTLEKQQYNARIYQPIGDNGDFISAPSITTRTATTSSVRVRCAPTAPPSRARPRRAPPAPARTTASQRPARNVSTTRPHPATSIRPRRASPMRPTFAVPSSTVATTRRTPATSAAIRASRWLKVWSSRSTRASSM